MPSLGYYFSWLDFSACQARAAATTLHRSAVVQLDERRGIEEEGKSQTAKSPL
ncbi:hypothetical protein [Pseudomonas sp. 65/3-MNA-CIBAN-0223]|uniref:hypothetical protein n=1 Tax=unclassified Pseudomonas TaxID=196821 RepID=UPI003325A52E